MSGKLVNEGEKRMNGWEDWICLNCLGGLNW